MAQARRWLLVLIVLLAVCGVAAGVWSLKSGLTPEVAEAWVASFGVWAPVGFVVLYSMATIAVIPGGIFDVVGGAVFGPYFGSLYNWLGGTLGAALAFLVARYVARDWLEARAGPRLRSVMKSVDEEGWRFVAFVRLVPIFPYAIVNYLLGLTRIPFPRYVAATLVFMAPSTVAYTWLGFAGREAMAGDTHQMPYAFLALALLGILIFVPRFVFKRMKKKPS
jgi:uncharacterized membrane protein YdjX (TVP38/TMEM64 family)